MRRIGNFSKGSSPISQDSATTRFGVSGAVFARRKFLRNWFLCRRLLPPPASRNGLPSRLRVSDHRSRFLIFQRPRLVTDTRRIAPSATWQKIAADCSRLQLLGCVPPRFRPIRQNRQGILKRAGGADVPATCLLTIVSCRRWGKADSRRAKAQESVCSARLSRGHVNDHERALPGTTDKPANSMRPDVAAGSRRAFLYIHNALNFKNHACTIYNSPVSCSETSCAADR